MNYSTLHPSTGLKFRLVAALGTLTGVCILLVLALPIAIFDAWTQVEIWLERKPK